MFYLHSYVSSLVDLTTNVLYADCFHTGKRAQESPEPEVLARGGVRKGAGRLPNIRNARREISLKPLRGTNLGVAQVDFKP